MLADLVDHVIGVDPDRDRITAGCGRRHDPGPPSRRNVFDTTPRGYRAARRWAETHTRLVGGPGRSRRAGSSAPGWRVR